MNFINGLLKTIGDGIDIVKISKNQNGNRNVSIIWDNVLGIAIGAPIVMFTVLVLVSQELYSSIEYLHMFLNAYLFLLLFSIIFRFCGLNYLGTYKYIVKYVINNK